MCIACTLGLYSWYMMAGIVFNDAEDYCNFLDYITDQVYLFRILKFLYSHNPA